MVICGLDIATLKSGCAIIGDGQTYLYSLTLPDKTPLEERIFKHGKWAGEIAARHDIEICFHEEVINVEREASKREGKTLNIRTSLIIAQVLGAVKAAFYPAIIHPLTPSEWRAGTVGNIPAKKGMTERDALKAAAIEYARGFGLNPITDDEAEAFCLAICGRQMIKNENA